MKGLRLGIALICILLPLNGCAQEAIEIKLHENTALEQKGKQQLERILESYELDRWIFTNQVLIQSFVIPHSHPVLTLNTQDVDNDEAQLATFLHEQIHWFADEDSVATEKIMDVYRGWYPEVPVRGGQGARSEYSTYLHLMICWLEYDGLRQLIGEDKARSIIENKTYYKWIYNKVLEEGDRISDVIKRHGMMIN